MTQQEISFQKIKAYVVLDDKKEKIISDMMGRMCYKTRKKAVHNAIKWGLSDEYVIEVLINKF